MKARSGVSNVARAIENDFTPFTDDQILSVYNKFARYPLRAFADRYAMERRTQDLLDKNGLMIYHKNVGTALYGEFGVWFYRAESHPSNVENLGFVHRDRHRVIRLLVKDNPKRGASRLRFALYEDGMTVFDYKIRARAKFGGDQSQKCESDLAWDTERGFIRVDLDSEQTLSEETLTTVLSDRKQ